ncbi:MAG: hypothetical protein ACI8RZ_001864 [Myxococcota bacterium]
MNIEDFFNELDDQWPDIEDPPITLKVIGSTALFLQTRYQRGTKDSDVIETEQLDAEVREQLRVLAGPGSKMHRRHRIYLDVVSKGIPLLPPEPQWNHFDLRLNNFTIQLLDIADVVVSKLKRFNTNDQDDIRAMVEDGKVDHERMVERFKEVIERYKFDGRAQHLERMADRLNMAERDWFLVDETLFPELVDLNY